MATPGEGIDFAAFGLDAQGNPVAKPDAAKPTPEAQAVAAAAKVTELESQIKVLNEERATTGEKLKLLDRLSRAITGEAAPSPTAAADQKLWAEFRDVLKTSSPAFYKLVQAIEKDPDVLEKMQRAQEQSFTLTASQVNGMAHDTVMSEAKGFFKGMTDAELETAVLPFEKAISDMINANPQYKARFYSGEAAKVSKELFLQLLKPHASARLRAKQRPKSDLPGAPPKGSGGGSESMEDSRQKPLVKQTDDKGKRSFDIRSPQGRAAFHKAAINRALDKASARDDE